MQHLKPHPFCWGERKWTQGLRCVLSPIPGCRHQCGSLVLGGGGSGGGAETFSVFLGTIDGGVRCVTHVDMSEMAVAVVVLKKGGGCRWC